MKETISEILNKQESIVIGKHNANSSVNVFVEIEKGKINLLNENLTNDFKFEGRYNRATIDRWFDILGELMSCLGDVDKLLSVNELEELDGRMLHQIITDVRLKKQEELRRVKKSKRNSVRSII